MTSNLLAVCARQITPTPSISLVYWLPPLALLGCTRSLQFIGAVASPAYLLGCTRSRRLTGYYHSSTRFQSSHSVATAPLT